MPSTSKVSAPRRTPAAVALALVALTAIVLAAPVLLLILDEGAVPPRSDVPDLPDDVRVTHEEVLCGSGGCYRDLTLEGPPDHTPAQTAASMGSPQQTCSARNLLDRRRVCTHVEIIQDAVHLYVQFQRPRWTS
ncbi:hypothetical protein GCM10023169_23510 [Georgenia halophila]|uniref:Uncharacterized protein n=1 Tax=Georgenia halophila TaxID=620889 RepID=A0ABP8LB75_9MICO